MGRTTSLTRSHSVGSAEQLGYGSSTTQTRNVHGTSSDTLGGTHDVHLALVGEESRGVDGAEIPACHVCAAVGKEVAYPNAASAPRGSWMDRTQNSRHWV